MCVCVKEIWQLPSSGIPGSKGRHIFSSSGHQQIVLQMVVRRRTLDKGIMRYMSSLLGDEFFEGRDHVERLIQKYLN